MNTPAVTNPRPVAETSNGCLPCDFFARNGLPIKLYRLTAEEGDSLVEMYLAFQPRNSFQGLPPPVDDVCVRWVRNMLAEGVNVAARTADRPVVGHAALFPVNRSKCEMLVVVSPEFHNQGIGTELVRSCVELAGELGFQRIWLPVEARNVRARHVYRKCGFEYVSGTQGRELDMTCELNCRIALIDAAHVAVPRFHFPSVDAR